MKNMFLLIIIFLLPTRTVEAQGKNTFNVGFRMGANFSAFQEKNDAFHKSAKLGVFIDIPTFINPVLLSSGMNYVVRGGGRERIIVASYFPTDPDDLEAYKADQYWSAHYMEFPFLIKYKIKRNNSSDLYPYLGYSYSVFKSTGGNGVRTKNLERIIGASTSDVDIWGTAVRSEEDLHGLTIGCSVTYKNALFDIHYYYGLGKNKPIANVPFNVYDIAISIGLILK